MSFDAKYFQLAEREISDRKTRNERQLELNRREIAEKYPEIAEIDRRLMLTGSKLIKLIIDHDKDFERKLGELEADNLSCRRKLSEALVRAGKRPDYLEKQCVCKKCGDSGVLDGKRCECFMEIVRRAAAADLNKTSPMRISEFSDFSLNYYDDKQQTYLGCTARDVMSENLDFCKKYAENFHLPCNGILMRGGTGLGKTHLSLSIAGELIKKNYSVIYGSAPDLFRRAEQEHFGRENGNTVETLLEADLLILDDIGAEFESRFYSSVFYNILNNRINAAKPTIISTNCDLNELLARYGERTVSRIKTMDDLIFIGNDVRLMRAALK